MSAQLCVMVSATRRALKVVTPGMTRLAALFTPGVRSRARPYLGAKMRIASNEEFAVSAVVFGAAEYQVKLERKEDRILYGCTCPYFRNGGVACKHLWALVLEANADVVSAAATCSHFEPLTSAPFHVVDASVPAEGDAGSVGLTKSDVQPHGANETALERLLEAQLEVLRQRGPGHAGRPSKAVLASLADPRPIPASTRPSPL